MCVNSDIFSPRENKMGYYYITPPHCAICSQLGFVNIVSWTLAGIVTVDWLGIKLRKNPSQQYVLITQYQQQVDPFILHRHLLTNQYNYHRTLKEAPKKVRGWMKFNKMDSVLTFWIYPSYRAYGCPCAGAYVDTGPPIIDKRPNQEIQVCVSYICSSFNYLHWCLGIRIFCTCYK